MKTILIAILAALAVYLFLASALLGEWRKNERLAHAGRQTRGRVVKKLPEKHNSVEYLFTVDGKEYPGEGSPAFGKLAPFSEIQEGDPIPVTYWPEHPSVSLPGDPAYVYASTLNVLFGILPAVSIVAGLMTGWAVRKFFAAPAAAPGGAR